MLKPNIKRALRVDGGSGRPDPGCRLNVGCGGAADPVISAAAAHVMRSIADAASRTCTSKAPLVPRLLPVPLQVEPPSMRSGIASLASLPREPSPATDGVQAAAVVRHAALRRLATAGGPPSVDPLPGARLAACSNVEADLGIVWIGCGAADDVRGVSCMPVSLCT